MTTFDFYSVLVPLVGLVFPAIAMASESEEGKKICIVC